MNVYKEVKQIAKCIQKIKQLSEKLEEDYDIADVDWETAKFVSLTKKQIKRFEETNNATEDYYVEQHQGYCEDDFYGWLWFKTDVPGQYIKVAFAC